VVPGSKPTQEELNALEYQELRDGLKHLYAIVQWMKTTRPEDWRELMEPPTDWNLLPPGNEASDLMIEEVERLFRYTAIREQVAAAHGTEQGPSAWRWIGMYMDDWDKWQQEHFPDRR
jgi:hypothetical protein